MVSTRRIERYALQDLMSESGEVRLWRAFDEILARSVTIRLVPMAHPRAEAVRAAARASATVDDRRLVRVLDVVEDGPDIGVVTEWVPGRTLSDLLDERQGEPLDPWESLALATEVARALTAGHRAGVIHGRLRPSSVLVTDSGEVRLLGLGVDSALWGTIATADRDPDVHGVGSVLYASITGHWPDGLADGLPAAPRVGQRILPPSAVVADVPSVIDDLTSRSVSGMTAPRGRVPYSTVDDLAVALGQSPGRIAIATSASPIRRSPASRGWAVLGRIASVVLVVAGAGIVAGLGWRMIMDGQSPWATAAEAPPTRILTDPVISGAPAPESSGPTAQQDLRIRSVAAFDPANAADRAVPLPVPSDASASAPPQEPTATSPDLATDGDPATAWRTTIFSSDNLDGAGGTGLVLDLGKTRQVSTVRLDLVGNGTDLEVRISDEPFPDPDLWSLLTAVSGVGQQIEIRSPRALSGRYVLVWFTRLPPSDSGGYIGGVRQVEVRG